MRNKITELLTWIKTADEAAIAQTGTSRAYLRMIAYGCKTASAEIAVRTEAATRGSVTREVLRPHDWQEIWPELKAARSVEHPEPLSHAS